MAKKINLGKVGITTAGAYDPNKAYERLSCVTYNYESWVSTKDVPAGNTPQDGSKYWQKMAARGAQGIQGEKGDQGPVGPQGPQGNSGYTGAAGELEVVNDLTKGGATAALSAEQGVVLKQNITELSGEIIELESLKTAVLESSVNLFNPTTAIEGYFWDKAGVKNATSGYAITAPVYLESGKRYKMPFDSGAIGSNNRGFLVTEDNIVKKAISGNVVDSFITFEIATSGYYSFNIGYASSIPTFMIAEEGEYPNEYVEYSLGIRPNVLPIVTKEMTDFWQKHPSVNLFNSKTAIEGYFWDKVGVKNATSGYAITAPVYLESGKRYKMPFDSGAIGSNNRGFLVTEDNTLINKISGNVVGSLITFEISTSGYYSFNIGYASSIPTFMIAEESEYPNGYVEYGFSWTLPDLDMASENLSKLHKKKVTFDGDSICAGAGFLGGYGKIIAEKNNMEYHNLGVGGGTITANTYSGDYARHWICQSVVNIDPNSDYVILEGGVNDSSLKVDLGEISKGYSATLDEATFCGAFESMIKKCYANFPSAKLGFIFPHKMTSGYYEGGVYYEKAISILHKWGVPYIDLTRLAPPLNDISALKDAFTYNSDGWHPNEDGYKAFYCDKIEEWMKNL